MNLIDIANMRLISQQVAEARFGAVKDLVGWMGAVQAQDLPMAKWALGVRLPGSTLEVVEAALDRGEILRTHLLRPTWHFVTADDIHWMLELTAPKIKASLKSRDRDLALTETVFAQSNSIIEKALGKGKHLLREELVAELNTANIATGNNRASHLLFRAELDGLVCSGAARGGKPTYALLEDRVPKKRLLTRDEALANLARRYFTSRCPATLQDFGWWSGLTAGAAKQALEMVKSDFTSATIGSRDYWVSNSLPVVETRMNAAYLLPAYDELIISYRDRGPSLPFSAYNKIVSINGLFRPVIVVNGQVTGIWKRTVEKDRVLVEPELFEEPEHATWRLVEEAAMQFGRFLGKEIGIKHRGWPTGERSDYQQPSL